MKYLLFISFSNGLMHNCIYNNLTGLCESLEQLVQEEELNLKMEEIPTPRGLKRHLSEHDDYIGKLTNNTWYHIQSHPVFGV